MYKSMWTYPWDILDLGTEQLYRDVLERANLNSISIALSYHAGMFVQPRSPRRKIFFPEDGRLYYHIHEDLYQNHPIKPQMVSNIQTYDALLQTLSGDRLKHGFRLSAWFVCLHNTRIGTECPDATCVNAFGDHYVYSLCPSNEAVQTYVTTALHDLTHTYDLDAVELESLGFMGFPHGFHHEKDGVGLNAYEQFLMSLCFCHSCKRKAASAGVDIQSVQSFVQDELAKTFEREIPCGADPSYLSKGMEYFADNTAFYAFLQWRCSIVASLAHQVRQVIHPDTEMIYICSVPTTAWKSGVDLHSLTNICDGVLVCCYGTSADVVARDTALARYALNAKTKLLTGLRVDYPEVRDAQELTAKVQCARANGADGFNFYNYGLIPEKRLDWVSMASSKV